MLVRSLLSAGIDTTITGLGNAVWCLAQNPDSFQQLRADPSWRALLSMKRSD